jgi:hypothetical protein
MRVRYLGHFHPPTELAETFGDALRVRTDRVAE